MTFALLPLLGWLSWFGALGFLSQGGLMASLGLRVDFMGTCGGSNGMEQTLGLWL